MPLTQQNRVAAVFTPLGEDVVVLKSFRGHEPLGRLYSYELELLSEKPDLVFEDLIGKNVTVRLQVADGGTRFFNGYISRFVQTGGGGGYARYLADVVPWLWFLTRTQDCRMFQKMTVPDILKQVFEGHGFKDFDLGQLTGSYGTWEYCVQYRETDFQFMSRLIEQEGIYYYFKHEDGKHTCVFADSAGAHSDFPGYEEILFRSPESSGSGTDYIREWTLQKELQPTAYALRDFNWEKPKTSLESRQEIPRTHDSNKFEIYDSPGEYEEPDEGDSLAKVRIEEIQARYETLLGQGDARGLCTGSTFTLADFPRQDQNRKYLITSTSFSVEIDVFETGRKSEDDNYFDCSFEAMDAQQPFRLQRLTPKPVVQGPQTALIVGPSGEEIHTDKYGRVKVKFHWDRYAQGDDTSSAWVRVAQTSAGRKWGAFTLPRVGQEVIVEFLEGDPDRPIITGRVYNAEAMPPYELPGKATISTIKTNSSKGGGGANEIRFEDKKGDEQVYIHGEKNLDVRVKNDAFEWIGNNRHLVVKKDQVEHVENNREEIVDADHKEKIGKDRHLKIVGKEAKEVGDSHSFTVKGEVIEVFKDKHSEQVTKDYYLKADNIVIEALTNLTLKVGGSTIAFEASGIGLKTSGQVKLESSATMDLKAQAPLTLESSATADLKSPSTTVKGDGMVTVSGGMVKIN